jgi:hypothetical protein
MAKLALLMKVKDIVVKKLSFPKVFNMMDYDINNKTHHSDAHNEIVKFQFNILDEL